MRRSWVCGWLKEHDYHFLFALAFLSLASLIVWWSVFIHRSIESQYRSQLRILSLQAELLAEKYGRNPQQPRLGTVPENPSFEIVKKRLGEKEAQNRLDENTLEIASFPLLPLWAELWVQPVPSALYLIHKKHSSLRLMLTGEATVLILVLMISLIFLYQYMQLEKKSTQEIRSFWERAAHELKTPLSGIKLLLQTLAQQKNAISFKPYLDLALEKIEEQEKRAEDLLSGFNLKMKDIRLYPQELDLTAFISQYFTFSPFQLSADQVVFSFDEKQPIRIKADPGALRIIFDHLIENALKYCSPGLRLKISQSRVKNKIVVRFQDNGPGFTPEQAKTIFVAFKHAFSLRSDQGEPRLKKVGSGMGLFIARELARKMGGDLRAFSKGPGKGAEFRLILPS